MALVSLIYCAFHPNSGFISTLHNGLSGSTHRESDPATYCLALPLFLSETMEEESISFPQIYVLPPKLVQYSQHLDVLLAAWEGHWPLR